MFDIANTDRPLILTGQGFKLKFGILGTAEDDKIYGTPQSDSIFGLAGRDTIEGGAGNDYIDGGDDKDWLIGEEGNDTLVGGDGDDALYPGTGNNVVDGGNGTDWIKFDDVISGAGFTINMATGVASRIIANGNMLSIEKTTFKNVEGAVGSNMSDNMIGSELADGLHGAGGNDQISGNGGNDTLSGGQGDDTVVGGAGNDMIYGDEGYDVMTGGAGADHFVFTWIDDHLGDTSWGTVTDFNYAQGDRINLWNTSPAVMEFIGGSNFTGTPTMPNDGEVRLTGGGGGTTVHIDYDGDGTEDGTIFLQGVTGFMTPGADAFIL